MAVFVRSRDDVSPFLGKKILRVSMSAYDVGIHFLGDRVMLIEDHWILKDKNGQEIDKNLGLKIRASSRLPVLLDQTLRKTDISDGYLNLYFDRSQLRIMITDHSYSLRDIGRQAQQEATFRWDSLGLTAPGYLLQKKGHKAISIFKIQNLLNVPEGLSAFLGQPVVRVSWSTADIGIYFLGQQLVLISQPWILWEKEDRQLDHCDGLSRGQNTALFRILSLRLKTCQKGGQNSKFTFEEGLVLEIKKK
jgi:hypothetical protein